MGTHPIFESDFDCLTEKMARSVPPLKSDAELTQALLQEALPMIRAGVNRLLADRPADAMAYLAEYFQSLVTTEPSSTMLMPKKKKAKPANMATKSLAELDEIMADFDLTPGRIQQFFSGEPEERARAGIAILQTEHSHAELVEELVDRIKL